LFSELRACNFGAVGTTRPYAEFPKGLTELKAQFATKLEWNTLIATVVQDVLCLAWQDNNIVLALSNIHTVDWGRLLVLHKMVECGRGKEPRRRVQILDKLLELKLYTRLLVGLFEES
jgi:hypothetical protein